MGYKTGRRGIFKPVPLPSFQITAHALDLTFFSFVHADIFVIILN